MLQDYPIPFRDQRKGQ